LSIPLQVLVQVGHFGAAPGLHLGLTVLLAEVSIFAQQLISGRSVVQAGVEPPVPNPAGGSWVQACVVPGVYEKVVRDVTHAVDGPDYRYFLHWPKKRWEKYKAEALAYVEELVTERLDAGEPLEVERWRVGGQSLPLPDGAPAWLQDRSVLMIRVFSDDRVVPVYDG
jgi:hypothetical protein